MKIVNRMMASHPIPTAISAIQQSFPSWRTSSRIQVKRISPFWLKTLVESFFFSMVGSSILLSSPLFSSPLLRSYASYRFLPPSFTNDRWTVGRWSGIAVSSLSINGQAARSSYPISLRLQLPCTPYSIFTEFIPSIHQLINQFSVSSSHSIRLFALC